MSETARKDGLTEFKKVQLRHRRQADHPNRLDDVDEWIDFGRGHSQILGPTNNLNHHLEEDDMAGTTFPMYGGPLYGLEGAPGFWFAPQALDAHVQDWTSWEAVTDYCQAPHVTNMDTATLPAHETAGTQDRDHSSSSLWTLWKQEQDDDNNNHNVNGSNHHNKKQQQHHHAKKNHHSARNNKPERTTTKRSFQKLTWATMGYHYDWTARSYNRTMCSPMPALIDQLALVFAHAAWQASSSSWVNDQDHESSPPKPFSFVSSACIVNYYHTKSLMGGHLDDLEEALDQPVVSLSFGLPAVFLLGGPTKEDTPIHPILVRPGDVMILGGPSRLYYHGMARILPSATVPLLPPVDPNRVASADQQVTLEQLGRGASNQQDGRHVEDTTALQAYLSTHRININVRQVYPS